MTTTIEIPLRNRAGDLVGVALVGVEDAHLAEHRWSLRPDGYVVRRKNGRIVRLAREVMGLEIGDRRQVDHVNVSTLDNRRTNLRVVSAAQNCQNRKPMKSSSRFRGVYWDSARGKYMARATLNYKGIYIGRFHSEVLAGAVAAQWRADNMPYSSEAMSA